MCSVCLCVKFTLLFSFQQTIRVVVCLVPPFPKPRSVKFFRFSQHQLFLFWQACKVPTFCGTARLELRFASRTLDKK